MVSKILKTINPDEDVIFFNTKLPFSLNIISRIYPTIRLTLHLLSALSTLVKPLYDDVISPSQRLLP